MAFTLIQNYDLNHKFCESVTNLMLFSDFILLFVLRHLKNYILLNPNEKHFILNKNVFLTEHISIYLQQKPQNTVSITAEKTSNTMINVNWPSTLCSTFQ